MDKIKPFIMDKDYDYQNDSLFLYVSHDHEYKESIELGANITLDFDKHYVPIALEILDASKVLGIEKFIFNKGFKLNMEIGINEVSISIKALFKVFKHYAVSLELSDKDKKFIKDNHLDIPESNESHVIRLLDVEIHGNTETSEPIRA
jgi:uncharacterized protein YuzE